MLKHLLASSKFLVSHIISAINEPPLTSTAPVGDCSLFSGKGDGKGETACLANAGCTWTGGKEKTCSDSGTSDPCSSVTCDAGEFCDGGTCYCGTVGNACSAGDICNSGSCTAVTTAAPPSCGDYNNRNACEANGTGCQCSNNPGGNGNCGTCGAP